LTGGFSRVAPAAAVEAGPLVYLPSGFFHPYAVRHCRERVDWPHALANPLAPPPGAYGPLSHNALVGALFGLIYELRVTWFLVRLGFSNSSASGVFSLSS